MINQKMWLQYITLALVTMAFATTTDSQRDAPWCKNLRTIHCAQHPSVPKSCPSICKPIKKMESVDGDDNIQVIQGPRSPISESITNLTSMALERDGSIQVPPSSTTESITNLTSMALERDGSIQGPPSPISESINNLTVPSNRMVNGWRVTGEKIKLPWIVALFYNNHVPFCTGTLINSQWILTAAHCVASKHEQNCQNPFRITSHFLVLIGEYHLYSSNFHKVVGVHLHDRYIGGKCNHWSYDFAVAKLSKPVNFSPVCFSASSSYDEKYRASQIGYGSTSPNKGAGMSKYLMAVRGDIVTNSKCRLMGWGNQIGDNKICIAARKGEQTTACRGDSGGPLMLFHESSGFIQMGVAAFVFMDNRFESCTRGLPNVYGRVSSVLSWIRSKVGSIKTC